MRIVKMSIPLLFILATVMGCTSITTTPISPPPSPPPVTANPVALFSVYPLSPHVGDTVILDATLSSAKEGSIINYTWDLGSTSDYVLVNQSSLSFKIIHVKFTKAKTYTIMLSVEDSQQRWGSSTYNLHVYALPRCGGR